MHSPFFAEQPLRTRDDLQAVWRELWRPLRARLEREGAAVSLEVNRATYGRQAASVETFVRPLWGVAALVRGGGACEDGELIRRVLAEGVDPAGPRYWGDLVDHDQRAVEMGSLAAALWLAPQLLWEPLPAATRAHLVAWLRQINGRALWDNNWLFFRVLVNEALRSVGEKPDEAKLRADLGRLDRFHRRGGWYVDGATEHFDYYIPMAMHLYGLVYAKLAGRTAPHATDFLERARQFAPDFAAWFAPDGSALPVGRSLAYRFAQGAFWGGLALADVPALPWGVIKHLHLQHLRWWLRQPLFVEDGLLSVGYAYPNQIMAEGYNAPGSPYWAAKAFLPLALPPEHPFWRAEERPPDVAEVAVPAGREGLVVCRDARRGHVFALSLNRLHPARHRHTVQKYGKFTYSTAFAFNVPVGGSAPPQGTADSMLLVSVDGRDWRAREEVTLETAAAAGLHGRWQPWPDVEIDTWLAPALPGHVRVHRIRSARPLVLCEGGFPLAKPDAVQTLRAGDGGAIADNGAALSGIFDLTGGRKGEVINVEPNTNLLFPLTVLPCLRGEVTPGETWLFTAVAGLPGTDQAADAKAWLAELRAEAAGVPSVWRGEQLLVATEPAGPEGVRLAVRAAVRRPSLYARVRARLKRFW